MNSNIRELCREAFEILVNARYQMLDEEITQDQYNDVVAMVIKDVGIQAEVITECPAT